MKLRYPHSNMTIIAPPGSGKSLLIVGLLAIAKALGIEVYITCPSDLLVDQMEK